MRASAQGRVGAEDFSAGVDYLGTRAFVERGRIGVIGICGSGSFAISAAKIAPRLKAVATVSMYDMGAVTRNGLKMSQPATRTKVQSSCEARTASDKAEVPPRVEYEITQKARGLGPTMKALTDWWQMYGDTVPKRPSTRGRKAVG